VDVVSTWRWLVPEIVVDGSMTTAVDRLAGRGLVKRRSEEERATRVALLRRLARRAEALAEAPHNRKAP
jgi:DNA-binding MarR family transcriptional regulator